MCIRIGNHEYDPNYFTQSFINHSLSMTGSGGPRKNTSLEIGNAILGKYDHHHNDNNDWESLASDSVWLYRSTLDSLSAEITYIDNELSQVITLANGIYASDDLQINGEFEQLLSEYFDENIHRVNFTDQSTVMQTINQWISSKTNNLIPQFFNYPHEILPNSLLNLFSVFYFKDVWEVPFMEMFTENATFEISSNRQIQVPIMFNEEELGYADFTLEGFEMISKSFKNTRFAFIVILPKEKWNLNYISQFLMGNQSLQNYIQQLKSERVSLKLPKFKLESTLDLENILKLHGIHDLFDPIKADLSGITSHSNIHVTSFRQKDVIRIDEVGMEARSVANAMFIPLSSYRNPIQFHITHPFICFVYDKELNLSLFAARVIKPLQ